MDRRNCLKMLGGAAVVAGTSGLLVRTPAFAQAEPAFKLPPLGYPYEALEPHIDTATMNFHHKNHHQAFINNLNGLVDKYADLKAKPVTEILGHLGGVHEAVRAPVRNNLGRQFNHTFF